MTPMNPSGTPPTPAYAPEPTDAELVAELRRHDAAMATAPLEVVEVDGRLRMRKVGAYFGWDNRCNCGQCRRDFDGLTYLRNHVALVADRLESLRRERDDLAVRLDRAQSVGHSALGARDAATARAERAESALRRIAGYSDAACNGALTLHYDMRGIAASALAPATETTS